MEDSYQPKEYWNKRLETNFNLKGVGHISFSEFYNTWLYRLKSRRIVSIFNGVSLKGKKVLDIGCGTGFFVEWYLNHDAEVCAVDISAVSVNRLKQKFPQGTFFCGDVGDPNFPELGEFDVVNMWDVLYHITDDQDYARTLALVARSCKSGGWFIFTDMLGNPLDHQVAVHVKFRCLETYRRQLSELGFAMKKVVPLYVQMNKWRSMLGRFNNWTAPLLFLLDTRRRQISESNLSIAVFVKAE